MCPVDKYPGIAVEQVLDSSRYFVIRIQDPTGKSQKLRKKIISLHDVVYPDVLCPGNFKIKKVMSL